MRNLVVVCCLAASLACGVSAGTRSPAATRVEEGRASDEATAVSQNVVLKVGQSADLKDKGLLLELEGVSNDSRCPVNVQCIWEGDALVRLCVRGGGSAETTYDLHTSPRNGSATVERAGYVIKLEKLDPVPHSERKIDPADYVATFSVTRR